jgi:hypothetical protein
MNDYERIWQLIDELENRISFRQRQLELADAAAKALDEKIVSNMAERLIYETECALKDAAGE